MTPRDVACKTEGQDGVAVSFLVGLFHSLQHAGLTRRSLINALIENWNFPREYSGRCEKGDPNSLASLGHASAVTRNRSVAQKILDELKILSKRERLLP